MKPETSQFLIVHDAMALTGETPLWDEGRQTLWWIDIQGQRLLGYRLQGARPLAIPLPSMPGLIALADDDNLVLGLEDGLFHCVPETRCLTRLSDIEADRPQNRLNDGKPDADGRLWFGSTDKTGLGGAVGALYCRQLDGSVILVMPGMAVPNAIAVSPDGATLYFANTPDQEIIAFSIDRSDGHLTRRGVFARFTQNEKPDGACVDIEGGLWVAIVGGSRIDRFLPDGSLDFSLPVPVTRPTMPVFGGKDMRTLFVTSQRRFLDAEALIAQPAAGSLIAMDVEQTGLKPFRMKL